MRHIYLRVLQGVFYALIFLHLELVRALSSSFWSGFTTLETGGILVGFTFFFVVIVTFAWLFELLVFQTPLKRYPRETIMLFSGMIAPAMLWLTFYVIALKVPPLLGVLSAVCMISFGASALLLGVKRDRSATPLFLSVGILLTLGTLCMYAAASYSLTEIASRVSLVRTTSFLTLALCLCAGYAMLRDKPWQIRRASSHALRLILKMSFSTALIITLLLPGSVGSSSVVASNLLLITCDTMRADYLSVYGGATPTPAMQQLADNGVLFEQSYSLAPWTLPSMQGMFSSRYPLDLPVGATQETWVRIMATTPFPSSEATLTKRLAQQGYTTAAFVGNTLLGNEDGVKSGFEQHQVWPSGGNQAAGLFAHLPGLHQFMARVFPALAPEHPVDSTRLVSDFGRSFLEKIEEKPFFLWIHFMDPHDPYAPPPKFRPDESLKNAPHETRWSAEATPQEQEEARRLYQGEIQYVDRAIGSIMESLDELGLTESTYICLTADHGEELWDHGEWHHGHSMYEELVRVPLILSGAKINKATTVASPVSAIDLMPTLADLLGIEPAADWQGSSLTGALTGTTDTATERPCYAGSSAAAAWPSTWRMVRSGDYKLIEIETEKSKDYLLFNLEKDPGEQVDLSSERAGLLRDMRALLSQRPQEQSDELRTPTGSAYGETFMSRAQSLFALGYIH